MIKLASAVGAAWIVAYGVVMFSGLDFSSHEKNEIPASVRASPGGYRSWSFWHSGLHGGK